jgi:hypothetical protein
VRKPAEGLHGQGFVAGRDSFRAEVAVFQLIYPRIPARCERLPQTGGQSCCEGGIALVLLVGIAFSLRYWDQDQDSSIKAGKGKALG